MRAWRAHELGEPEAVLVLEDVDPPDPGPGEVAIDVRAAAADHSISSGIANVVASAARVCSAKAPRPALGMASTRALTSPGSTPSPTPVTTPATSAPGVNGKGGFTWYSPRHINTSGKLSAAARTSIATSPGPGSGGSTSSRTNTASGSPSSWARHARMHRA